MSNKKTLTTACCLVGLLIAAGCDRETKLAGRYQSLPKTDAVIVLYFKSDGTLIRAEGLRGGNFEKETPVSGEPRGLGRKLAEVQIWEHDGSFGDVTVDASPTGATAHPHSTVVNPPLNTHCHRYIWTDSQWLITHCT